MIKARYLLLFVFFFAILTGKAQENSGGGIDDQTIHFGFNFQYVSTDFKIIKKHDWRKPYIFENELVTDSLYSIASVSSPGFGFGFVSNLGLNPNTDIRFTPSLIFVDRLLDYEYANASDAKRRTVQSAVFDLPLGVKFKSDRRKNFRAYVLGGVKYSIDISSKKKSSDEGFIKLEKFVKNRKNIMWYEVGVGFDFYFEYFKMSPELKISNSVGDVLKHEDDPYATPIDKLLLHNLHFSLYFE